MKLLKKLIDWYRYEAPAIPVADTDRVIAITRVAWERHREQGGVPVGFIGQSFHYYRAAFFGSCHRYIRQYFAKNGDYPAYTHYIDDERKYPFDFGEPESRREPEEGVQ